MNANEILKALSHYGELPLNALVLSYVDFQWRQEQYFESYFFSGKALEIGTTYILVPSINDCPEAYYLYGQRSAWCGWEGMKYMVFPIEN